MNGADLLCATLEQLGVECVFGVAGTQNIEIFESLRKSKVRIIAATHEMAAAFMAVGYYRATGKPGVVITIPGPGFSFALPAIAEAKLDSSAVIFISGKPTEKLTPLFQLQDIDQCNIAAPLVKRVLNVATAGSLQQFLFEAFDIARSGEPGPVFVEIARSAMRETSAWEVRPAPNVKIPIATEYLQIFELLKSARRPAFYVGQGVNGCPDDLRAVAEWVGAPVFLTTSARGALAEDHLQSFPIDKIAARCGALNEFLAGCDLIVAVGVKFTHNGSIGYRLKLQKDALVHVDAAMHVPNANYPAKLVCHTDAPTFFHWLQWKIGEQSPRARVWNEKEILQLREKLLGDPSDPVDPKFISIQPSTAARFFDALRVALPKDGIVVTDSGLHQLVARRHFTVLSPRSFIIPTDFQSMGFAVPTAMAAKAAFPSKPVVALLGDAGFAMMGLELLVACRDRLPFVVIVFNDRQAGLIRVKQIQEYGRAHGTEITNPDFQQFAASIGVDYIKIEGDPAPPLAAAIAGGKLTIVEVPLADASSLKTAQMKHAALDAAEKVKNALRKIF